MRQRSSMGPIHAAAAALLPCLLLGCREDGVRHYRVSKVEGGAAPAAAQHLPEGHPPMGGAPAGMGGEVAEPPHPTGPGTLQWTLPKGWTEQPGEGMRFATLKAPAAGDLEITVVVLGGAAGGVLENVNRWRDQVHLPHLDASTVAKDRRTVKSKAGELTLFDFSNPSISKRLVAGMLSTPDGNTWFLKMVGAPAAVAKASPDFYRLLESLRLG